MKIVLREERILRQLLNLKIRLKISSKEEVIEEVSYTWFNRFIALQYMDINGFNDVQVIMNLDGKTRPEIFLMQLVEYLIII